jgi:hypothetical protein
MSATLFHSYSGIQRCNSFLADSALCVAVQLLQTKSTGKGKVQETYYGITAPLDKLKSHAERMELEIELTEEYGSGYLPYLQSRDHLYKQHGDRFFSELDRYKILQSLISSRERAGGAGLSTLHFSSPYAIGS